MIDFSRVAQWQAEWVQTSYTNVACSLLIAFIIFRNSGGGEIAGDLMWLWAASLGIKGLRDGFVKSKDSEIAKEQVKADVSKSTGDVAPSVDAVAQ